MKAFFACALPITLAALAPVSMAHAQVAGDPPAEAVEAAPVAPPETKPAEPPAEEKTNQRVFGLGVGAGGGVGAVSVTSTGSTATGVVPLIYLPTIETQIFIPDTDGFSIDISVPITTIVIGSIGLEGLWLETDAFFNFGPGGQNVRLVAGPGIGFNAFSYQDTSFGGIRFLGELGFEALTNGQGFSFKLLARPFFEVFMGDLLSNASAIGGGATALISFSGNYVQ
ncbi:MAG: hypothetical protein JNK04_02355 [Myxococcales bacterium]|nr:hypothetical protein [Myxococcales bacterium]